MSFAYSTTKDYLEAAEAGKINGTRPLFRSSVPLTERNPRAKLYEVILADSLPVSSSRLVVQPYNNNFLPFGSKVEIFKRRRLDDLCEAEIHVQG